MSPLATPKARLGFAHCNEVPPRVSRGSAEQHDLIRYLPTCYE